MPPPKARLHNKTGKLKTINKSYTSRRSNDSGNNAGHQANNSSSISASVPNNNNSNTSNNNNSNNTNSNTITPITTNNNSGNANNNSNNSSLAISSTSAPLQNMPSSAAAPTNAIDSDADQQFELELCWCIQTMEKSLDSGNVTAKQGILETFSQINSLTYFHFDA